MKQYRLVTWPDNQLLYGRTAYRRALSDMSQRHMTFAQLLDSTGLRRQELRGFVDRLVAAGLVDARDVPLSDQLFGSLRPMGGWLRRAIAAVARPR